MSRLRILFHFYQNFLVPLGAINLISALLIQQSDSLSYAITFGLIKILVNILVCLLYHLFRSESLYYYNNLGLSTSRIYISAMALDFSIWVCLVITFSLI